MRYRISIQSFTLIWLLEYFSVDKNTSRQRDWETYGWTREGHMLFRHLHTFFQFQRFLFFFSFAKGTTVSRVRFTPFPSSRSSLEGARSRGARCSQKKKKKRQKEIFSANFWWFFSGFRAKFQKRVTSVAFQSNLRKQIRKLPKILKSVKSIQYYSFVSLLRVPSGIALPAPLKTLEKYPPSCSPT